MKNIKKILLIVLIILIALSKNIIYAAMADYTDEQADLKTKQQQENWQKEQYVSINKSSNNDLKSLIVKGYELSKDFDKEIIDYEITKEVEDDYIEIIAETEDTKATISGNGKITLTSGENNLKISVTAENGEEKLYFIRVVKTIKGNIRLNSLKLRTADGYDIEITPQFDKDIFEYSCTIQNDIDKIDIEAVAGNVDDCIEIVGNENLKEGQNEVIISVFKNDNEKTIYKINITKERALQFEEINNSQYLFKIIIIIIVILLLLIINKFKKLKILEKHS